MENRNPIDDKASNAIKVASLLDMPSGWYEAWFFGLRLHQEIARAKRTGRDLTLLLLTLPPTATSSTHWRLCQSLGEIAGDGLRAYDIPGLLTESEYAVLLPETSVTGAEIVAARLTKALAVFEPQIRLLSSLDEIAADESLSRLIEANSPSPVDEPISLAEFRARRQQS